MVRLALLTVALLAALAPAAHAHAILTGSEPARGAALERAPDEVTFRFNEPIEASFGALRVYDASGERIDDGRMRRPGGRSDAVAVGLHDGVGSGRYTATYRVVSADSHPVSGGFVFTVGSGAAAPAASVSDLLEDTEAGAVTKAGFGVVRAAGYAAAAAAIGALALLLVVWAPALAGVAGAGQGWLEASGAMARRAGRVLACATVAGVLSAALALVFQGALAAGTSVWAALDPSVVDEVLSTRFGTVTLVRLLAWVAFGAVVLAAFGRRRAAGALRPATLGAAGLAPARAMPPAAVAAAAAALLAIAASFGLGGHAGSTGPTALLVPADTLHVVAMGTWIGGLVLLLAAVPAATRRLAEGERTRLLAAVLVRFSPLAVAAVATLVVTGTAQAVVHLGAVDDLWETAFGRSIAIKVVLLGGLVALGYVNRRRLTPRLRELADRGEAPGRPGRRLRTALRAEIALAAAVLGVTAALVSYAPASGGDDLLARSLDLGPAKAELTIEPLRAGPQEIHVYLFDRETGAALDPIDEFGVTAALPDKDLGPLDLGLRKAGPGHYTTSAGTISPAGEWEVELRLRTNRLDIATETVRVEVR